MPVKGILLKILILFFIIFNSNAQEKALSLIDKNDLKRHLSFISSDDLQGRKLGTEVDGLGITADYLAENAKKIGLEPGAVNYFQNVELVLTKPIVGSFLGIKEDGNPIFESTELVKFGGSPGVLDIENEEFVFIGFGAEENLNSDLEGKIVIISQGDAEEFASTKWEKARWNNTKERAKIEQVSKKNPKAILIILSPNENSERTYNSMNRWMNRERYSLNTAVEEDKKEVPVVIVSAKLGDAIAGSKEKYIALLKSIAEGKNAEPISIENKRFQLKIGSIMEVADAKNVVGVVEGSDPELKDECVVFMAHYDHLGIGKDGDVYNGADDNGSGTVTLLEVAEAFMSFDKKPKRSIVFLWVTCEEIGMLGSRYYTENPIFPLEKTVTCINIDMDGRVFEARDTVWNRSPKKVKDFDGLFTLANDVWPGLKEINTEACNSLGLIPDYTLPAQFLRASDHYHFHNNGVPILNYATGYHADYHKVGDEISRINFDKMKRVADLCFLVGYEIANRDKIEFDKITTK